ncbi:MAG TPA: hypothetical protein QF753_17380 [Victivallales bacterium]|nr:hypothetical protein [Victivallales bacterium]
MYRISQILTIFFVVFFLSFSVYSKKKAKRKGSKGKKIGTQRLSSMRKGITQKKSKPEPKLTPSAVSVAGSATGKTPVKKTVKLKRTKPPKNIINGVKQPSRTPVKKLSKIPAKKPSKTPGKQLSKGIGKQKTMNTKIK